MILPDWPTRAKIQARAHCDQLVAALDDHDFPAAYRANCRLQATTDWLGRELAPLVVNGDDAGRVADLQQQLFLVRQQWQHSFGAPRDRADLAREQARLVAELSQVTA